jgi:hypothetical protein
MALGLHEFATSELHLFETPDRCTFATLEASQVQDSRSSHIRDFGASQVQDSRSSHIRDFGASQVQDSRSSHIRDFEALQVQDSRSSHILHFEASAGSRFQIFVNSVFLKTHYMNFIYLDVSRVTGFPEFPNTSPSGKRVDSDDPIPRQS